MLGALTRLPYKALIKLLDDFPLRRDLINLAKRLGIHAFLLKTYLRLRNSSVQLLVLTNSQAHLDELPLMLLGGKVISKNEWKKKLENLRKGSLNTIEQISTSASTQHYFNGLDSVSVISSLYRSDEYLDKWIRNLESQTIFTEIELIIVSVNPSRYESERLDIFADTYSNVKVIYEPNRIGIYEAWNIAVRNSHGSLITNANVDDLRRFDSLEIQRSMFSKYPFIHITYQDVLFSFVKDATWHEIEILDQSSYLPHVTLTVLTSGLNPPHNAPMWRKNLHDELGFFDENYSSAGDYEFWFRCLFANKTFLKNRKKHVSYFYNPKGLSTKRGGAGLQESIQILKKYQKRIEDTGVRLHELNAEPFTLGVVHTLLTKGPAK